jgi:hypothetical protein
VVDQAGEAECSNGRTAMNRDIMSLTTRQLASVMTLLAAFVLPSRSAAQRYAVTELPGLGGSMSLPESINNRSWISGGSNLSGDQNSHASLWVAGHVTDLGTLGGPDTVVVIAAEHGQVRKQEKRGFAT